MSYISREELLRNTHTGMSVIEMMQAMIDAPVCDVRENVRGEWVDSNGNRDTDQYRFAWWCSNCGNPQGTAVAKTLIEFTADNPFCHHCGADMRGERNNEV